jgi:bacterioferritin-associated ferredoxin
MIVCICNHISDKTIIELLDQGYTDLDIINELHVGEDCGVCIETFIEIILTYRNSRV